MFPTDADLILLLAPGGCDLLDGTIGQLWLLLVMEPIQEMGVFGALAKAGTRVVDVAALPGCLFLKDSLLHLCLDLSLLRWHSTTSHWMLSH